MKRALTASVALTLLAAAAAMAHPHFNKTVTAKLPSGVDATITYNTTPANEIHAAKVLLTLLDGREVWRDRSLR